MALITLKDYWWNKLKAYQEAGVLHKCGVACPQCGLELWTTAPDPLPIGVVIDRGDIEREVPTWPAICINGHQTRV